MHIQIIQQPTHTHTHIRWPCWCYVGVAVDFVNVDKAKLLFVSEACDRLVVCCLFSKKRCANFTNVAEMFVVTDLLFAFANKRLKCEYTLPAIRDAQRSCSLFIENVPHLTTASSSNPRTIVPSTWSL
ncbi:hypothetical protein D917_07527 [Trichinella nativa]|uniref:Uncharacterized protein n=1 Tax=Trichinella nativa TaxID=6335 RepID=A0A1Y3ENH3_9BILA|nr:hypothetical protein D917_07527 [Trichinella nativa]